MYPTTLSTAALLHTSTLEPPFEHSSASHFAKEPTSDPNSRPMLFALGRIVATPAALNLLAATGTNPVALLERHQTGDWGDISADDSERNTTALVNGYRIMSVYRCGPSQEVLWILTEADRSSTAILTPADY